MEENGLAAMLEVSRCHTRSEPEDMCNMYASDKRRHHQKSKTEEGYQWPHTKDLYPPKKF